MKSRAAILTGSTIRKLVSVHETAKVLGVKLPKPEELVGHEDNVGAKIVDPLLVSLGYDLNADVDRKPTLTHEIIEEPRYPDYGVLKLQTAPKLIYGMVIDTKSYNSTLLPSMESKLAGYCGLAGAAVGILTNGVDAIILEPTRGVIEWQYHTRIPTKDELSQWVKDKPKAYSEPEQILAVRLTEELDQEAIQGVAKRCHEIIRSRKGLAVPDRLYEFSKLLITRIVDERRYLEDQQPDLFLTTASLESLRQQGVNVLNYVNERFEVVRDELGLFESDERIDLDADVVEEIIKHLDKYPLWSDKIDVLGDVYEKFLMKTMTGQELGQYFTPRTVIETILEMLAPTLGEPILDPACGTGGFLIAALNYLKRKHTLTEVDQIKKAANVIRGIDLFPIAAKLCQINLWLHGDCHGNIEIGANSLVAEGAPSFLREALVNPEEKGFPFILTNPPFGSKEGNRYTEEHVKALCSGWHDLDVQLYECGLTVDGKYRSLQAQAPFIELCIKALRKPSRPHPKGGRLGIVIDNGVLSNIREEAPILRTIIRRECIIEAVVGLPKGTFKPYGSNVIPTFLILRRKAEDESQGPIFRAEATRVGLVPSSSRYKEDSNEDLEAVVGHWEQYANRS